MTTASSNAQFYAQEESISSMEYVADGIHLNVERGPNWLFVKFHMPTREKLKSPLLADELWSICDKHFTYRIVIELDDVDLLPEIMMAQIIMLQERLVRRGGALKICGLSEEGERTLHSYRLERALPNHTSRVAAVLGNSKLAPREHREPEAVPPVSAASNEGHRTRNRPATAATR